MKIYTKTGDDGSTALFGGGRVSKSSQRIAAYGTVDELNAQLGVVRAAIVGDGSLESIDTVLGRIQAELFVLGADLATPADARAIVPRIKQFHTDLLENDIDRFTALMPELRTFILPAGTTAAVGLHLARTVCRRGERLLVQAATTEDIGSESIPYINRLSDLLFVMARLANHVAGVSSTAWQGK